MKPKIQVERVPNRRIAWFNFRKVISQSRQTFWRPLSDQSEKYLKNLKDEKTVAAIRRIIRLPGVKQVTVDTYHLRAEVADMYTRDEIEQTALRIICEEIFNAEVEAVEVQYK